MNLCELGLTGASADNWQGYSAGTNKIEIFSLQVLFWMKTTQTLHQGSYIRLIYFLEPKGQGLWSTDMSLVGNGKGYRAEKTYWLGLLYP